MMLLRVFMLSVLGASAAASSAASKCAFCGLDSAGRSHTFDLSALSTTRSFSLSNGEFAATSPCGSVPPSMQCAPTSDPVVQGCRGLGTLANTSVQLTANGFNITMAGGSADPPCGHAPVNPGGHRRLVYEFVCDANAAVDGGPEPNVTESPGCTYVVTWRHPAACDPDSAGAASPCAPPPPAPPVPAPTMDVRKPSWTPTWNMARSTVLYTCNNTGFHNVTHATKFGLVVYDWSNAKALWANAQPMNSEELLTKQCEAVLAADPGVPGEQPRCWVYRNTIKALNWYTSVRQKLDDPRYSGWFIKFRGFSDVQYPGGQGKAQNGTFHVPTCDWFGNATHPPKCSGFYHDQEQTPEHQTPTGGSWPAYRVDGACMNQCDCGAVNPCGEYIFDHRNASFAEWFINEYMISAETLLHKPLPISLGWLDDSMQLQGPTEEDTNFVADTNSSASEMQDHVMAYRRNMYNLAQAVVAKGGFWWQLVRGSTPQISAFGGNGLHGHVVKRNVTTAQCINTLRNQWCVTSPAAWENAAFYEVRPEVAISNATDLTAEFLLTRGEYAWLGYGWVGCTNGEEQRPRPAAWDVDYGSPQGSCAETVPNASGVFRREWTKATVTWDCHTGHGAIITK